MDIHSVRLAVIKPALALGALVGEGAEVRLRIEVQTVSKTAGLAPEMQS